MAEINPDLQHRLSSWRHEYGVVEHAPESFREPGVNEAEVRTRQRRVANMCLNTVKAHDAFVAQLKAFVENNEERDPNHQNRVEDEAAFALGVYEQMSALLLERGIRQELDNLPKEIVETVFVPTPSLRRSGFSAF